MTCRFAFWTPGHAPADDGRTFGGAAHGYAGTGVWHEPNEPAVGIWPHPLPGEAVGGSYDEVWAQLARITWRPAAAILLFSHAQGIETFLQHWHTRFAGVPVAGGGAALRAGQVAGELLPAAADIVVFLIREGVWQVEALNVHDLTGVAVEFRADGPRTITHLRAADGAWQPAAAFFRGRQAECGRAAGDCESITLCDLNGRNIHAAFAGERLHTGADLPESRRLQWRTVSRADAAARLAEFCAIPRALVFGCAGLRGLLDVPLPVSPGTLVGFMFGEVVTLDDRPQFGNLMAARLLRETCARTM